jgi:hypothetical protein
LQPMAGQNGPNRSAPLWLEVEVVEIWHSRYTPRTISWVSIHLVRIPGHLRKRQTPHHTLRICNAPSSIPYLCIPHIWLLVYGGKRCWNY